MAIKENIYKEENNKDSMKRGDSWNWWDVLIWLGILFLVGWAFLKATGIIHSPIWVEMVPYFGAGATAIGGSYKLGKIMKGIEETNGKVDKLLKIEDRFVKIENEHNLCMDGKLKVKH